MRRRVRHVLAGSMGAALVLAGVAEQVSGGLVSGRLRDPKVEPLSAGQAAPAAARPTSPPLAQPSLDELLGLPKAPAGPAKSEKPTGTSPEGAKPEQPPGSGTPGDIATELDRLLKGEELGEAFEQAVGLMQDAKSRLNVQKDAGVETQRVQEDIIRKLDQLLKSMEQNQQSSSSSSSSSPSQQNQPRPAPSQPRPGRGQGGQTPQGQGDGQQDGDRGGSNTADLKPGLDSARAAWGSLPERVRDMLMQGSSDRFSSRYQALTEQYYKRLAEEQK
jgi:hypothetical protein